MAPLADQFAVDAHCEPPHLVGVVCPVIELGVDDLEVFHVTGQRLLAYAPERRRLVDLLREGALRIGLSIQCAVKCLLVRQGRRLFPSATRPSRIREVTFGVFTQQRVITDRRYQIPTVRRCRDLNRLFGQSQPIVIGDIGRRRLVAVEGSGQNPVLVFVESQYAVVIPGAVEFLFVAESVFFVGRRDVVIPGGFRSVQRDGLSVAEHGLLFDSVAIERIDHVGLRRADPCFDVGGRFIVTIGDGACHYRTSAGLIDRENNAVADA